MNNDFACPGDNQTGLGIIRPSKVANIVFETFACNKINWHDLNAERGGDALYRGELRDTARIAGGINHRNALHMRRYLFKQLQPFYAKTVLS